MTRNKIGFHTSVGGNPTGIGAHLQRLDEAGIPFFIKTVDGMTGVFDAQEIMRVSSVPHTAVYRRSVPYEGSWDGYNPDVPDYTLEPETAAVAHWDYHKRGLPPELDRNLVWIETINEVRKEVEWGDWLGRFALKTAQLMNAEGFKFAAFGFSAGTPEIESWETPGMLAYLRYCAEHPGIAGVALHEYSYTINDIWNDRGYLIGRFERLFEVCDQNHIARPKVLITEWGWEYDNIPDTDKALADILAVAEYYAKYPEILGAAIWYLGAGFGGVADKTQRLIEPLTDLTITTEFDPVEPPKPAETMGQFLERIAEANRKIDYNSLAALERAIVADGFVPYGQEKWATYGNQYAVQGARLLGSEPPVKRIYYVKVGDWNNINWVVQGEEPGEQLPAMKYRPCDTKSMSQAFNVNPANYPLWHGHMGVDLLAPAGWPYYAVQDGVVVHASDRQWSRNLPSAYGWHVVLKHSDGSHTIYAHAKSNLQAQVGDTVLAGKILGYSGNSGHSSGYHLHFGLTVPQKTEFPKTVWGYFADPTYIIALPKPPATPPPSQKIDLLPYVHGSGILYEVVNANGGQERFQSQTRNGYLLQTKNANAESFFVRNGHIYRDWDTSPGGGRFYRLLENGQPGSAWVPQEMGVGETFTRSRRVQFYNWDCSVSEPNSGNVTDSVCFVSHYDSYTFRTGITLPDVIKLEWVNGGEIYFYAKGYGLVGWERKHQADTPQWSAISEIHAPGQRPDNVLVLPSCL